MTGQLSLTDAWNQAAASSGLDSISMEMGVGMGIALMVAEIVWWVGIGYLTRKGYKLLRRKCSEA